MTTLLDELGELLRYPGADYLSRLDRACAESEPDESRALLEKFRAQAAAMSPQELQELYTRTFDLSPLCSLEVGWQLYGEDYARGSFLVYMRSKLREHGLAERGELPDHLSNLLRLLARMPAEQADELREGAALPALRKMMQPFSGKTHPYGDLLLSVILLLQAPVRTPAEEVSHV